MRAQRCAAPLILAVACLAGQAQASEPIVGRATVTDGDTVEVQHTKIRLYGIDAPESAQLCRNAAGKDYRCGQQAALALSDKIGASPVTCQPRDKDRYGRTVAVCSAQGQDLNAWMVSRGHALAYRQYGTEYVAQEDAARAAKAGIWAGTFTPPWEWRRGKRDEARTPADGPVQAKVAGSNGCKIKGNVSRKGDRIFHIPGSPDYERTVINEGAGERWFCTEQEAIAAGWRARAK